MGEKENLPKRPRFKRLPCPKCGWRLYPGSNEEVRIVSEKIRHDRNDDIGHYTRGRDRIYKRYICDGKFGCGWKGRWRKLFDTKKGDAT